MSTDLFGWDKPLTGPTKRRTQPRGNAAPVGSGPAGETCRSCAHCYAVRYSKKYYKCDLVKETRGPGSDIKLKWPACARWEAKETEIETHER